MNINKESELEFYNHVFKCGNTEITRRNLDSFPFPFSVENVTNEQMQFIANEMDNELKKYLYDTNLNSEELKEEYEYNFYYEMDIAAVKYKVEYGKNPQKVNQK